MIDTRLQLLVAVSEHGTVTAAAESLYRSPSGVSKQLKELARDLDVDLLERRGRRVRLTAAGDRLVEHVRSINAQWELALTDTATAAEQLTGTVVLGAFPTALAAVVAPGMTDLRALHPTLRVTAREVQSREALLQLERNEIDVAVVVAGEDGPTSDDPRVDVIPLGRDPIDLLVPSSHPFATRESVDIEETSGETWITGDRGQDSHTEILAATRAAGFTPRIAHRAQEFVALTALVSEGFGITAIPRLAAVTTGPGAVRVPLAGPETPSRRILACTRRGSGGNPRFRAVTDQLRACTVRRLS